MPNTNALPGLHGAICDLITPFRNGELDRVGFMSLVEWQILNGISGLVVCGQAGEAATLTRSERTTLIELCVDIAEHQVPVLVGTGTSCTESTIALTAEARNLGADGAVIVVPYYNKPTQEGILRHFEAVSVAVDIPIIICNVPSCTAVDLAPQTLERLTTIPQVVAVEDCTGDITRISRAPKALRQRLQFLSGHDVTALTFNLAGGRGTISLAANIAPRLVAAMHYALQTGNTEAAIALGERLGPLLRAIEREDGPAAAKYALQLMHGLSSEVRLPLTAPQPETIAAIRLALAPLPEMTQSRRQAH
ncbi:4-hydroxy-tetrahydrodipicolinate synthase [Rhizobiaceae bacterium n13]|uniref:4-hydroxy-tetrahydrodipicolinate synthase n=1 Tax=Ferirhizobium litorale TaxID=2927786 RepID=A0AAE3QGQ4_9HYPH|nr:4-hydroxy-tetrahydrodipicolinate synthase [Fererhizobium litorale]MDI7865149.1 4-hydroxy-tetrahydrodipicolinate synthase [Fererhizobium litorale]MDI7922879.1 4-hydroxy-tetrahydrodipicolinate synthase [Fererhizobium litorale]